MKSFLLQLLNTAWSALPSRLKVHFIQSDKNFGLLDTSKGTVKMKTESVDTLMRLHSCAKEPDTIKWLDENMKASDVLYDIGANVGAYSLYAAQVHGTRVMAFEPSPSTFHVLLENIHLNRLGDKIKPFNIPLSSSTELKEFKYATLSSGAASHAGLEASEGGSYIGQPVFTLSLDDLVLKYKVERPTFMKIDVDGHELDILKGAREILRDPGLKQVQIELSQTDKSYDAIVQILAGASFRIGRVGKHPKGSTTDIVFVR
jgi:FkbM family methyltransferase